MSHVTGAFVRFQQRPGRVNEVVRAPCRSLWRRWEPGRTIIRARRTRLCSWVGKALFESWGHTVCSAAEALFESRLGQGPIVRARRRGETEPLLQRRSAADALFQGPGGLVVRRPEGTVFTRRARGSLIRGRGSSGSSAKTFFEHWGPTIVSRSYYCTICRTWRMQASVFTCWGHKYRISC